MPKKLKERLPSVVPRDPGCENGQPNLSNPPPQFIEEQIPERFNTDTKDYKRIKFDGGPTIVLISDMNTCHNCVEDSKFKFPNISTRAPNIVDWSTNKSELLQDRPFSLRPQLEQTRRGKIVDSFACAAVVRAGYLHEPVGFPGLAHLLEHVLFRQTLDPALGSAGADGNAFTEPETTTFWFSKERIEYSRMASLLEIFAGIFTQEKIVIGTVRKEVDAIEYEYRGLDRDHIHREDMLKTCVEHKDHPVKRMQFGNRRYLHQSKNCNWIRLVMALQLFRKEHYRVNQLTVVLQASLPMRELETLATQYFGSLRADACLNPDIPKENRLPFDNDSFHNKIYFIQPHSSGDNMYMSWALPAGAWINYDTKPLEYISTMLSSGILGGLVDVLTQGRYIYAFECGVQNHSQSRFGVLFAIKLGMTQLGLANLNVVVSFVFSYIDTIKNRGVLEEIYENQKKIMRINLESETVIRCAAKNVQIVANSVGLYDAKDILTGPTQLFKFSKERIMDVLMAMNEKHVNIMLVSYAFGQQTFPDSVPFTDCHYRRIETSERRRKKWNGEFDFKVPDGTNQYLIEQFGRLQEQDECSRGTQDDLAVCTGVKCVWIPLRLSLPITMIQCEVLGKTGSSLALCRAMLEMFCSAVNLTMRGPLEDGVKTGMGVTIGCSLHGSIIVNVTGHDVAAESMFLQIMHRIMDTDYMFAWVLHYFVQAKEMILQKIDRVLNTPKEFVEVLLEQVIMVDNPGPQLVQFAVCETRFDDFRSFLQSYFVNPNALLEISGNATKETANRLQEYICQLGFQNPLTVTETLPKRLALLKLPLGSHVWQVYSLPKTNQVAVLKLYIPLYCANEGTVAMAKSLSTDLRIKFNAFVRARPYGYESTVDCIKTNDTFALQFTVLYDAKIQKDTMIDYMDQFLRQLDGSTSFPHTLKESRPDDVNAVTGFINLYLQPDNENLFRGLYIQVIARNVSVEKRIEECWDAYRRPRGVTVVDNCALMNGEAKRLYFMDVTQFQEKGEQIP